VGSGSRRAVLGVDGLNGLKRTMKAAGVDVADLKAAHAQIAQLVVTRALPNAPRRTGALAASVRGSGQAGAAVVRAGRAAVPYANPIHWGWPSRHIKAQPFLYDAIADSADAIEGQYLAHLQTIIDSIEGAPGP
jgi:hypothetical protein